MKRISLIIVRKKKKKEWTVMTVINGYLKVEAEVD